jgi:hypothetical protein
MGATGAATGATTCGTGTTGTEAVVGFEEDIAKMMKPTTSNIIMIAKGETRDVDWGDCPG